MHFVVLPGVVFVYREIGKSNYDRHQEVIIDISETSLYNNYHKQSDYLRLDIERTILKHGYCVDHR